MAQCDECGSPVGHNLGCKIWHRENIAKIDEYTGALKFIADLAGEDSPGAVGQLAVVLVYPVDEGGEDVPGGGFFAGSVTRRN